MENQAKKRKAGAKRLRNKKTSRSLDKVLPIEKMPYLFYIKLKKLFCAQIKAKNFGSRTMRTCIN